FEDAQKRMSRFGRERPPVLQAHGLDAAGLAAEPALGREEGRQHPALQGVARRPREEGVPAARHVQGVHRRSEAKNWFTTKTQRTQKRPTQRNPIALATPRPSRSRYSSPSSLRSSSFAAYGLAVTVPIQVGAVCEAGASRKRVTRLELRNEGYHRGG